MDPRVREDAAERCFASHVFQDDGTVRKFIKISRYNTQNLILCTTIFLQ